MTNNLCKMSLGLTALAILGLTTSRPAAAAALNYTVTDLGSFPGAFSSDATGINNLGQAVGTSSFIGGPTHAALYSNDNVTDLGTLPGGDYSAASGINDSGQVVGSANIVPNNRDVTHAALYSDGQLTDLNSLIPADSGLTLRSATGINNSGQIVGNALNADGSSQGFLYSNGVVSKLPSQIYTPAAINNSGQVVGGSHLYSNGQVTNLGSLTGGFSTGARGINNSGQVVGTATNDGPTPASTLSRAFLYSDGTLTDLGILPGYRVSGANGINDSGQVVGYSSSGGGFVPNYLPSHAFLYSDGVLSDLNTLIPADSGWTLSSASAINNQGQIVGYGTLNGQQHAFLATDPQATPVPEPSSVLGTLAFSALGAAEVLKRKLRKTYG